MHVSLNAVMSHHVSGIEHAPFGQTVFICQSIKTRELSCSVHAADVTTNFPPCSGEFESKLIVKSVLGTTPHPPPKKKAIRSLPVKQTCYIIFELLNRKCFWL